MSDGRLEFPDERSVDANQSGQVRVQRKLRVCQTSLKRIYLYAQQRVGRAITTYFA